MSRVAINLCDLDTLNPRTVGYTVMGMLLQDFVRDNPPTAIVDKSAVDGMAVILDGPAAQDQDRVDALVTLLQTVMGPRKIGRRVRCYREGAKGGWSQIMPGKTNRQLREKEEDDEQDI